MSENDRVRLGRQLREARKQRRLGMPEVARRVGRQQSRISEIETGSANATVDSVAEVGAAIGLTLVFVPENKLSDVMTLIGKADTTSRPVYHGSSVYEEVFIPDEEDEVPNAHP